MNFSFIRKTSLQVEDIWEDGEFQNDCCRLSGKKFLSKTGSYSSGNLRIVIAVVTLIASRSRRLTEVCFLQTKATNFLTMMTTVNVNNDKTKVPDAVIFVVFRLFLSFTMSKLIHNRWTCNKTTAAYVYANHARGEGGWVLPQMLGQCVWPASQIPYPICDQNLRCSLLYDLTITSKSCLRAALWLVP